MSGILVHRLAMPEVEINLVNRCLNGEPAAWETIVRDYGNRIRRMAYRYVALKYEAEDLTQEVFVRVYRNLGTFRADTGSLQNWLVRIGRNLMIDHFRQARRLRQYRDTQELDALKLPDDHVAPPDLHVEREESAALLEEGLRRLPRDLRQVLVLRFMEGMSYQEMSDKLGVPEGTIKSRVNRGCARLRSRILKRRHHVKHLHTMAGRVFKN